MPNVFEPEWDGEYEFPPLRGKYARVARQAGAQRLGAAVYEVAPGAALSPLHVHHANEEMIVVLKGTVVLRTANGAFRRATSRPACAGRGAGTASRTDPTPRCGS